MASFGIPRVYVGQSYDVERYLTSLIPEQVPNLSRTSVAALESALTTVDQRISRDRKLKSDKMLEKEDLESFSSFEGTLDLPVALQAFRRFLAKECSDEHLEFLLKRIPPCSRSVLQALAKSIYEMYIVARSTREININSAQRAEVQRKVEGVADEFVFAAGEKEVLELLTKDSWQRFVAQPMYGRVKERIRFMNVDIIRPRTLAVQYPQDEDGRSVLNNIEWTIGDGGSSPCDLVQDMLVSLVDICDRYVTPFGNRVDFHALANSFDIAKFQRLLSELQHVELSGLKEWERSCFFVNLYNLLSVVVRTLFGFAVTAADLVTHCSAYALSVGGLTYSLDDIQCGILGVCVKKEWKPFKKNDPRRSVALLDPDVRLVFCLSHLSTTDSVIHIFDKDKVTFDLQVAATAKQFLSANIYVSEPARAVFLPRMFKTNMKEFGANKSEVFQWISGRLDCDMRRTLEAVTGGEKEVEVSFQGHSAEWDFTEADDWFESSFSGGADITSDNTAPGAPTPSNLGRGILGLGSGGIGLQRVPSQQKRSLSRVTSIGFVSGGAMTQSATPSNTVIPFSCFLRDLGRKEESKSALNVLAGRNFLRK